MSKKTRILEHNLFLDKAEWMNEPEEGVLHGAASVNQAIRNMLEEGWELVETKTRNHRYEVFVSYRFKRDGSKSPLADQLRSLSKTMLEIPLGYDPVDVMDGNLRDASENIQAIADRVEELENNMKQEG